MPTDWDMEAEQPTIRTVEVNYTKLPDSFFMTIQTPEMAAQEEPTAIIVNFRASAGGVAIQRISGMGTDWIKYLGEVTREFPPTEWQYQAIELVAAFLRIPAIRAATLETVGDLPRTGIEGGSGLRTLDAGVQRRRKITPGHLKEVARVYAKAQENDDPPTRAVQHHFGVSHSTAAKWVGAARRNNLLPPVESAGE